MPSLTRFFALLLIFFGLATVHSTALAASTDALLGCDNRASATLTNDDGSVFVVGTSGNCDLNANDLPRAVVIKLDADGDVDETWSEGGLHAISSGADFTGAILAGGGKLLYATGGSLTRLGADGMQDPSFGDGGVVSGVDGLLDGRKIAGITLDSQGRTIVLATGKPDVLLARFDSSGVLDPSFGMGGLASPVVPSPDFLGAQAVTTDATDKVIFAGLDNYQAAAMRLLTDGEPDTSFGPDDNGYAKSVSPAPEYMDDVRAVRVGPDGLIRMSQQSTGPAYCFGYWFQATLDADGEPVLPQSYPIGCGYSNFLPLGGVHGQALVAENAGRGVPPSFQIGARDDDDQNDGWMRDYGFSPGPSGSFGIEALAGQTQLLASGYSYGGDCVLADCPPLSHMAVKKVSRVNGDPVESFGTDGSVLIPGNRCMYGKSSGAGPDQVWSKCLVKPPSTGGFAKVFAKDRKKPALKVVVTLPKPPLQPGGLVQKVELTLPSALRIKRPQMTGKIQARAKTKANGQLAVRAIGRQVRMAFRPKIEPDEMISPIDLRNAPIRFELTLKRGFLKPLRNGVKVNRLRIPVRAVSSPGDSRWFGTNSKRSALRVTAGR